MILIASKTTKKNVLGNGNNTTKSIMDPV